MAIAALTMLGCSGGNDCARKQLELRAFEGDPVTITAFSCSGDIQTSATCAPNQYMGPTAVREFRTCAGLPLLLNQSQSVVLDAVVLYEDFDDDGALAGVRAQFEFACDEGGCTIEGTPPRSGWIMPEVASNVDGMRNAGRFHLEFERGVVEGTYDTAHPGPPGVLPDAGP